MFIKIKNQEVIAKKIAAVVSREINAGCSVLLLLPGGSAAMVAVKVLQLIKVGHTERLSISLTDDRFGLPDHAQSNWPLIFDASSDLKNAHFLPVLRGLSMQQTANSWESELCSRLNRADKTIALFGIGEDGHIAGIKPNSVAVNEHSKLVVAYDASDFQRITIAPAFFDVLDYAFVYAEGSNKQAIIEKLDLESSAVDMPAQKVKDCESFMVYYKSD